MNKITFKYVLGNYLKPDQILDPKIDSSGAILVLLGESIFNRYEEVFKSGDFDSSLLENYNFAFIRGNKRK